MMQIIVFGVGRMYSMARDELCLTASPRTERAFLTTARTVDTPRWGLSSNAPSALLSKNCCRLGAAAWTTPQIRRPYQLITQNLHGNMISYTMIHNLHSQQSLVGAWETTRRVAYWTTVYFNILRISNYTKFTHLVPMFNALLDN